VSTIRTDADVATWRNVRFIREKKACQSNIANLGVLKFRLAFAANKNPLGHLSPQMGDSPSLEAPTGEAIKGRREKQSGVVRTGPKLSFPKAG
jgi:hypothetical protein